MKIKLLATLGVTMLLSTSVTANEQKTTEPSPKTEQNTKIDLSGWETTTIPKNQWLTEADLPAKTVTVEDLREAQKQGYTKDSAFTFCMYLVENYAALPMYARQNGVSMDEALKLPHPEVYQGVYESDTKAAYDVPIAPTHEGKKKALDRFVMTRLHQCIQPV